ncbi:MAG: hypothetical protein ABSA44_10510 [Bacteroidota bacterium]|jgi:outer membrane protein W
MPTLFKRSNSVYYFITSINGVRPYSALGYRSSKEFIDDCKIE